MAKYEISHPELPQLRGILELKDGEEPSDQHFWEAAKTMVRPYGASQLSNEAKISAYKNGFFDIPSSPILDVDDDPETIQDEKSPGLLSTLGGMARNLGTRIDPLTSPYSKVLQLDDEAVSYDKTENIEQFREAGKRLFGLLDNQESLGDLGFDPISEALKQTGMPFYQKNKDARGRVKAAAMDYATDNIKSSVGMGTARAWKTPEFLLHGGATLSNYLTLDEEDDGEVLSYVNSLIGFDKVNYEYETAAEFAAWVMDNPVDALKATVGIEPESMTFDSQLEQDLRSGFQVPSEGIGLAFEVFGDPLNAAGGTLAKGVTAPMRIGLKGRMLKTIKDVQQKTIELTKYQNILSKLPEDALVRGRVVQQADRVASELAEQQKVLQKYGSNSLHLRLMGKASPETLGKVAMETFDQSTDAGKMGMGLVQEATKATDKMSKLRRVANTAAKLNPEIVGASVGALVAGPIGAAVGASLPTIAKIGRFLSSMTENSAIRYIINAERQAGREVTIESARQRYKNFKNLSGTALGLGSAAGFSLDQDALGGGAAVAALATFIGPKALSLYDNIARDARVVGSELTLARTGDHTPFFRRLSMLPTPDQGLAGATMDKFNILMKPSPEGLVSRVKDVIAQGGRASAKEVNPSAQPFRVGPGGEKIGQAPTISNATQKVANFLDNAGVVGRLGTPLETLGRFGKGMAAGASLPATIGFVASAGQPSGAVAGAIMSAPFTALGAGAGMYENYKTKGDLYSKQIGDIQYYREHLTKSEQAEFDAMPAHIRTQIAGYSLSHPDVVFKQTTKGEGGFNPVTMEVSYNPNGSGYLKGTLAHELTHFMEVHGLTPMVNRILFGDKETKTAGEFASYDKDGNVVYTDEFIELRDIYMDRLRKDASLDPEEVAAYESDPTKIGREIFADQGADFLLTGKREKALNQGPAGKAIQATIDGITGVSFLRDFLLKLNQPLNADGKFITSTDLFKGKLRKIPELQNLIEKYYKDVRGLKKAEIEGSEFTDPNTGKTRKTEGKKPIDDEFETLYTVEDQKNPNVVDKLNTGGIYKTDPQTGEIEKDTLGNPIRMTKGEADKVSQAAGDHAADVLQKNGIDVETNDKGRPFAKDLPALSEAVIDQLAKGPIHPRQIAALREISRALRQGDGERAGMLIGYYSATQGRKPKAVPFAVRTTMPYGFELTAQGNILVRIHDVGQIQKNLEFLKGERQPKKLPDELIGMYDELFGNDNAVWDAFSLYRQNTANGIDGRTGLDADPVIANKKLNFLNALHGGITKSQVAMNPVLDAIGYNMAAINKKHNPFGPATKTFRLDRVFNAERSGQASPVNEQRVINLMSPEAQKLYTSEADVAITEKLFMPRESKGLKKKVLLRTTDELVESIKAEAKSRGISANDVYNERLANQLPPQQENPQPVKPKKENDITLNPEELRLLEKKNIGPEDAKAYRKAIEKRRKLAEKSILGKKLFMPLTEAIDARSEWLSKTFSSKNFQDFITRKGKPNFALKNKNGDYLPVPWYHGGTIGEGNKGKLKDWTFKDNLIWLSADREFAREFSMYRGADPFLYEAPMRSASDVGDPIMVATNASNVFHYGNPEHIKMLREKSTLDYYEIEDLRLGEWYDVEPHLKLLQDLGFDGTRIKQDGTENVVIFDRKDIKLIRDVNDPRRSVEVSGKFIGDELFLPQLKFDFDGKGSAVEMSPVSKDRAPTFWKLFKINPKDPKVYDKVADVLIDTGTPSNDPANALDHGKKLGIDPKKLRQAMARAQRRYYNKVGRLYMPTAYHGTPHTFSAEPNAPLGRFRSDKIGTGEGNQAYGHGLYFAGTKEVANWYKEKLETKRIKKPEGQYLNKILEELEQVESELAPYNKIVDEAYESGALRELQKDPEFQKMLERRRSLANQQRAIYDILEGEEVGTGSLYEVDLAPKENEYVYYDEKLKDQPQGVQNKLKKLLIEIDGEDLWSFRKDASWTDLTNNVLDDFTDIEISQLLKEVGIPGIKFIQRGDKYGGKYNYIIFDEADITVTDKLFMPASEAGAGKGKQAEAAIPTEKQARANMQKFLKTNGKPFFAEKVQGGFKPQVLFHRGKIGEKIEGKFIKYDKLLQQFKEKLGDKPSWIFQRPIESESRFLKDHFGMDSKDAIYTSENLGGRFSKNDKTETGEWRDFKADNSDPVNKLPDDTIRVVTNISKVWDYNNIKDVERVLKEVQDRFTTTEMFTYGWVEGGAFNGKDGISADSMRITWLRELPSFDNAVNETLTLQKQREGMVDFLNEFNLFDKYKIDKSKLLTDDQYFKDIQDGMRYVERMLQSVGEDIAIMRGLRESDKELGWSKHKYYTQQGVWSNESLIPIIESLGYEGMRNIDSDSGGDVPSKSVLIFDSKNIKLVHGKGFKNLGTFDPNNSDIRYMPASEAGAGKGKQAEAAKLWNKKGTDSPYFKKWFDKSKVVDENGDPLVVYRGDTEPNIEVYDLRKAVEVEGGIFFTDDIGVADQYTYERAYGDIISDEPLGDVTEAYLSFQNPLEYKLKPNQQIVDAVEMTRAIKSAKEKGHDGLVVRNIDDSIGMTGDISDIYVAFKPEQIKSATGNRGTFDAGERNINYMPSDPKAPKAQPANRIKQQAPSMPGNRFMLPAATAGAKSAERFR